MMTVKRMIDMEYVPYNNANKDRARAQRREQTIAERIVWEILRKQRLGCVFLRQKMIDSFILDFYCAKLLLGIEIDGGIHKARVQYDLERDTKLHKKGIKIIRCKNESAHNDMPGLEKEIKKEIKIREEELNCS